MMPEFTKIVNTGTALYAEIFWYKGELGAPYPQWWDLATCEFRIKTAPTDKHREIYQRALDALNLAITAKLR